jgi:hypothetical protein
VRTPFTPSSNSPHSSFATMASFDSTPLRRSNKFRDQYGDERVTNASHVLDWDYSKTTVGPTTDEQNEAISKMMNHTNNLPIKTREENFSSAPDSDIVLDKEIIKAVQKYKETGSVSRMSDEAKERASHKIAIISAHALECGVDEENIVKMLQPLSMLTGNELPVVYESDKTPRNIWFPQFSSKETGLTPNGEYDMRTTKGQERAATQNYLKDTGLRSDKKADERTRIGKKLGIAKEEMTASTTGVKMNGDVDNRTHLGKEIRHQRQERQSKKQGASSAAAIDVGEEADHGRKASNTADGDPKSKVSSLATPIDTKTRTLSSPESTITPTMRASVSKPTKATPSAPRTPTHTSTMTTPTQVSGYTRSNGTVVSPYSRSSPSPATSTTSSAAPAPTPTASATTQVSGYTRSNGTVVSPYSRSSPSPATSTTSSACNSSSPSYSHSTSSNSMPTSSYGSSSYGSGSYGSSSSSYGSSSSSYGSSSSSSSSSGGGGGGGGGTYVSGYTRSNGTVVSGYYRGGK